jgi:START domain
VVSEEDTMGTRKASTVFAKFALWLGLVLVGLVPTNADADEPGGGWVHTKVKNGIVVSRMDVDGSPFRAFRGEGDIDAPILLVGSVLVDVARGPEWIDSIVDAKIVRQVNESEYITYSHAGTPITMSDRDFVVDVKLSVRPAVKTLAIQMHSVSDPAAPATHFIRGELQTSSFVLTSIDGGRRTHVVAEVHCDPKGSIAAWLVNDFQNNWGYKTLSNLRAQVQKPSVAVHPRLKAVLIENGFYE